MPCRGNSEKEGSDGEAQGIPVLAAPLTKTIRVVNFVSGKVHMWVSGQRSVCSIWMCGTPDAPADTAVFADADSSTAAKSTSNCTACFSDKLNFLKITEIEPGEDIGSSDDFEDDNEGSVGPLSSGT